MKRERAEQRGINKHVAGLIRLLVAGLLAVALLAVLPPKDTRAAAHLNKYRKTLYQGESFRLQLLEANGTVTFSSSNKKVATVNKNGKVRAKKRGTAVITAKVGQTTHTCTVNVHNVRDTYMSRTRTLINLERRKYGLTGLDYDRYLQSAARIRAKELATSYSHIRPNKTQFTSAISLKYNFGYYCYEVIGRKFTSPKKIVSAWMSNADTKKAIIGKGYEDVGVGYYVAEDGTEYWCAIMSAKK
ncbi:MAG: Ig-like domain-containing protein [Lachnospiraceae bacterium]|nr:Ig-like domain-containing protein [Lachnospiraceae bacterium]